MIFFAVKFSAAQINQILRKVNIIEAVTFGERLNSDTAVIHVEKADPTIRGIYAAINQSFVENEWSDMTYINREEDMGIDGLRRAKESYRPVKLIEKFNAEIISDVE